MRRRPLAAVAVVAVLLAGLGGASAASLSVNSGALTVASAQACTSTTIAVTRTQRYYWWFFAIGWEGVSFTVPPSCRNLPIQITAVTAAGAADAQGQLAAGTSNGAVSLTLDDWYQSSTNTFALIINGWYVPTSTTP